MPESFDHELNAHYKREGAREARSEAIRELLTDLYDGMTTAELYQNGNYKGDFTLEAAIDYAIEHDDDDNWTIEEVEE
jgi:Arc/MetJ-type ribon-helix-helix transcriptional regulator